MNNRIAGRLTRTRVCAFAAAATLVIAACGGDDDAASSSDTGTATTVAAVSSEATAVASSAETSSSVAAADAGTDTTTPTSSAAPDTPAAEGEPVKVMVWGPATTSGPPPEPGMFPTAQIAADEINARGGLGGRPVEVITCDEKYDPNEAERCARTAVAEGVIAVVGSYSFGAARYMPILEEAGIAYLGGQLSSAEDTSSPVSYPINGGFGVLFAGLGYRAAEAGCTNVAYLEADIQGSEFLTGAVQAALAANGVAEATVVRTPITGGDLSAQAATATDGTDCIISGLGDAPNISFLTILGQLGSDATFITCTGCLPEPAIAQVNEAGGPTQGILMTSDYPAPSSPFGTSSATLLRPQARTSTSDVRPPRRSGSTFKVLEDVANQVEGELTAESLRGALDTSGDVDTGGLTEPLNWTDLSQVPGLTRVPAAATAVRYVKVDGGKLVEDGEDSHSVAAALGG